MNEKQDASEVAWPTLHDGETFSFDWVVVIDADESIDVTVETNGMSAEFKPFLIWDFNNGFQDGSRLRLSGERQ